MNQRLSPRKPFQTRVVFEDEFGEELVYFVSTNISSSGIFIQTRLPFKAGTKVFLKFSLAEGSAPIRAAAEITRFHDRRRGPGRKKPVTTGLGLRFLGLSRDDFTRVENFILGRG